MSYTLVKYPDPKLSSISEEVKFPADIVALTELKSSMVEAIVENNGYGLSAIQADVPIRMLVMKQKDGYIEMCNPKVLNTYGKPVKGIEGCLSFPDIFAIVSRIEEVEVEWAQINGTINRAMFNGIEARCILHEIDHMDGITFIKRMTDVERFKIQQKLTDMRSRFKAGI
jgi:peptide deformylase